MLTNIKQWGQDTSHRTKIGFSVGVVLILLLMSAALLWLFRSDYQVLFSDLNPRDAAILIKELDKLKTPYELADGGTSILVTSDVVYKTRLKLMGQNIPLQGGVGFEIFNNSDFGMTEFAQKVNYQRALEGELARTIMAFDEVKFARIHIVMPESGLFKKNKTKPKASVTLIMKPEATLRSEQVIGIQRLIAASVPEIEQAAVTVLDHQGIALSQNPREEDDESNGLSQLDIADGLSQRLEIKKQVEAHMVQKLADVLNKTLGPDQAIVSVDISLNYDRVKITKEDVLGTSNDKGEIKGVVIHKRDSVRGKTVAAGAPGTSRSEGGYTDTSPTGSSNSEIDYQTGRRIEEIVSMPGSIRRISVGILVPNHQTEEELQKIKEVIQMAAGISPERGDAIAVYSLDQLSVNNAAPGILPTPGNVANTSEMAPGNVANTSEMAPGNVANTSEMAPDKSFLSTYAKSVNGNIFYLGYGLVALLLLNIGILFYRRKSPAPSPAAMSSLEREQVLRDIRTWLAPTLSTDQKGNAP